MVVFELTKCQFGLKILRGYLFVKLGMNLYAMFINKILLNKIDFMENRLPSPSKFKKRLNLMYIVLLVHLFLALLLPSHGAYQPLDTEGYCYLSEDNSQDNEVCYNSDIFADNCDDNDEYNNENVSPLGHINYSSNPTILSHSFSQTKTFTVFLNTLSFPQQKLFLLYNQLKLDC